MPKDKSSFSTKFNEWIKQIKEDEKKHFEKSDKEKIYCNVCCKIFNCGRKFQLDQHISTTSHTAAAARSQGLRQMRVNEQVPVNNFNDDLCKAFLAADVPFNKLENPILKNFLEQYCNRKVPNVATIRTRYVPRNYENVIQRIREDLVDKYIWMGVDETTDKCGRFVANVIVGNLDGSETKPRLLMSQELSKTDNSTVTQLILEALHFLWPNKRESEINKQFAVLFSDAAPYMVKVGKNLKNTYPGLLHVTCLAHGLHRVAETVRDSYKNVDKLLGAIKAVFKKSPYRVRKYNEMLPGVRLPPEPILTRWGTWLETAEFLTEHFDGIRSVVQSFDSSDAECIRKSQELFGAVGIKEELAQITSNYVFLAHAIKKLETRNLSLIEATEVISQTRMALSSNHSRSADKIKTKFEAVLAKNPDMEVMIQVGKVLNGDQSVTTGLDPALMVALKYAPLTSVEVERSFSQEKAILSDRRRGFTMKNFEMHAVCHFEMNVMNDSV